VIVIHYSPTTPITAPASLRPGTAHLWWTDTDGQERSAYLHPDSVQGNATPIDGMRPACVRQREWVHAVSIAVCRGANGETGRIAVEVTQ
jgi:hypothetical protein